LDFVAAVVWQIDLQTSGTENVIVDPGRPPDGGGIE
jgi:hypothetical protein